MAGFGVILTSVIFFTTEKEVRHSKQSFFILTIFDFMSNCTNFELLHAISFLQDNLFVADLHWVT